MLIKRIAVLGGAGFVGRSLCNRLSEAGYALRVLTRNREYNRENLILLPRLDLVQTDVHHPERLRQNLAGCDAVINLIGILNEKGNDGAGFLRAHVKLAENLIDACEANGIRRVLQMSALNADAVNGASHYLRSKGRAEDLLHARSAELRVTSFRPSVIFGPNDSFFNRFARLLRLTPLCFPLACYNARFTPVYVLDVVEMMTRSLKDPQSYNRKYQLCGPRTYTLRELVEYTARVIGVRRRIIPLNDRLSRLQAAVFDFVPGKPFSTDNYLSAQTDSVCEANDLARYALSPTALESVVPGYLNRRSYRSAYALFRGQSRRD